jgi:hypothetical protein
VRFIKLLTACAALAVSTAASAQSVTYNNLTTLTAGYSNGGSVNLSGNMATTMVADDISIASPTTSNMTAFAFSVVSFNPTPVSARPLIRFYNNDGAGGGPGTFIGGFNFNAISFPGSGGVQTFSFNLTTPLLIDGTFWAAMTFDNNGGATGATQAQMDQLGQGLFNPPSVGSSLDVFWQSTAAGTFAGGNNPAGGFFNFGGTPVANFGWQFTTQPVPEPGVLAMIGGIGAFALIRRRRTA